MTELSPQACGQCACGQCRFPISGKPLMRMLCHCRICQKFNDSAFADIAIFRSGDIDLPDANPVEFQQHKSVMAVQRGKCTRCGKPAVERFDQPLLPTLVMMPSQNLPVELLPQPVLHMFYHRRLADADDNLPKYSGALRSQLGMMRHLIPALLQL